MLFGLAFLVAATVLLCSSRSIPMLMAGRVLQGTSGGVVWSASLALITDTVDSNRIGEAMGWTGSAISLGALVGPMVGGIVYARAGYYPVFIICFAVIAVDFAMRLAIIENSQAARWTAVSTTGDDTEEANDDAMISHAQGAFDNRPCDLD